jgi:hypothetical protein
VGHRTPERSAKPKSLSKRKFTRLLSRLETAAQELSWIGSRMAEEYPPIEKEYEKARAAILEFVYGLLEGHK